MIYLKKNDFLKIFNWARTCFPEEACGILAGEIIDGNRYINEVYLLENIDHTNTHFSMDPKMQLEVIKDIRNKKLTLIGNFHSHPETPSRMSKEDLKLAFDNNIRYLILSLKDNSPILNAFIVNNHEVVGKEEIKIYE